MKFKYFLATMLVGGALIGFTSCDDDNDSNPTLRMPETFQLNTPALAEVPVDLEMTADSIRLTWSQPDYGGMPLVTTYYVQYGIDDKFETVQDEEGNVINNFIQEDEPVNVVSKAIAAEDLNRNLMKLLNVTSADQVPENQDVYFRVSAQTYSTGVIYSNIVKMKVQPYFRALVAADPFVWYMTGSCIGDGSWGSVVPTGCMPMYLSQQNSYDELDGTGDIVWAGYLNSNGFKFRGSPDDNWAVQIGQGDAFGEYKLNDGGSGNITVPEDTYYMVVLNTKTNTPVITPFDGKVRTFSGISMAGSFNGWGDAEMTPVTTVVENHDWYATQEFAAGDEVKFKETGTWDTNWGGTLTSFSNGYYGNGEGNGYNLYIAEAGTYDVYFNDLLGVFRFVRQ